MKINLKMARKISAGVFISVMLFGIALSSLPIFVQAQGVQGAVGSNDPTQNDVGGSAPNAKNFQLVSCNPTYDPANPGVLKNDCNYQQLVATVYRFIVYIFYIIIPIVTAMILYTGFKYMTAGGDAGKLSDAKRMLKPVILGVFFIFAAWLIVHTILDKLLAPQIGGTSKASIIGN